MVKNVICLLLGVLAVSCNQSPIFYAISQEVEPRDPKIGGMPTSLVLHNDTVYAASRFSETIHEYAGVWQSMSSQPGGKVLEIAGTTAYLYALTGNPGSAGISRYNGTVWESLISSSDIGNIQTIYGVEDGLLICTMDGSSFTILVLADEDIYVRSIKPGTRLLKGAAVLGTNLYLATAGDGILTVSSTGIIGVASGTAGQNIRGIITVGDKILAVTKGELLYGDAAGFTSASGGVTFTGGLGVWQNPDDDTVWLLLLGIQGSSGTTTHGYREIVLESSSGNLPATLELYSPGTHDKSSVTNEDKYNSSLRRHPVIGFLQNTDAEKMLFAATVKNGLWAYRDNVWNAED